MPHVGEPDVLVELLLVRVEAESLLVGASAVWYWAALKKSLPFLISCFDLILLQPDVSATERRMN